MSPLYIEIALHYHCRVDEFPRLSAPACRRVVEDMCAEGLLEKGEFRTGDISRHYAPTDGLHFYVEALCSVPCPVKKWVMPE